MPQWITANARIYDILSVNMSSSEKLAYSEYVKQIGDLLQIYTSETVFCMDHAHRKEMASGLDPLQRWCDIDQHYVNFYLERQRGTGGNAGSSTSADGSSKSGDQPSSGKSKNKRKRFAIPCVRYNSKEGCKYKANCTFPHICSESGCMGNHPNHEHSGFRNDSAGKSTTS